MKLKINVTQNHIDAGTRFSSASCPISIAASDAKLRRVCTTITDLSFSYKGVYYTGILPLPARNFAFSFDQGKKVQPFEFEMEIPEL